LLALRQDWSSLDEILKEAQGPLVTLRLLLPSVTLLEVAEAEEIDSLENTRLGEAGGPAAVELRWGLDEETLKGNPT